MNNTKQTKQFSLQRFLLLFRNEFALNQSTLLITVASLFGLLLLINIASVSTAQDWNFHLVFYPLVLMIGGHIITSTAFHELHSKEKSYTFITLPASLAEKYLVKLILTSIGYAIASLIVYFVFSLVAVGLSELFFDMSHPIFNPFHPLVWRMVSIYIATHAVTFFGAVFFKRLHLLNTILWITIIGLVLGFVFTSLFRLVFWEYFEGFSLTITDETISILNPAEHTDLIGFFNGITTFLEVLLYGAMPVFFWVTGFIRLRETEV
jgi:hypothetical protein